MRTRHSLIRILILSTVVAVIMGSKPSSGPEYTTCFKYHMTHSPPELGHTAPELVNPFFSLRPGKFMRLEGEDDGQSVCVEITVLHEVQPIVHKINNRWIATITTVVEEREWIEGDLSQVSRNFYARDPETNSVFYYGEDVDHYEHGEIVSHEDTWRAGRDGTEPGLIMPGVFLLGSRYHQELAPGVSMDRAEHVASGLRVETAAGVFENCVMIRETTPLEPDEETLKVYAPGVGVIRDDFLHLVDYH